MGIFQLRRFVAAADGRSSLKMWRRLLLGGGERHGAATQACGCARVDELPPEPAGRRGGTGGGRWRGALTRTSVGR
jgi:hypothetical protein